MMIRSERSLIVELLGTGRRERRCCRDRRLDWDIRTCLNCKFNMQIPALAFRLSAGEGDDEIIVTMIRQDITLQTDQTSISKPLVSLRQLW